jgi:hypothetical protein
MGFVSAERELDLRALLCFGSVISNENNALQNDVGRVSLFVECHKLSKLLNAHLMRQAAS